MPSDLSNSMSRAGSDLNFRGHHAFAGDNSYALELGGRKFEFRAIPNGWQDLFPERLSNCQVSNSLEPERSILITMSDRESIRAIEGNHDLNLTSHLQFEPDLVRFQSDWCQGEFNASGAGPVEVEIHVDSKPWFAGVIENIARLLMAYSVLGDGGVMLHCAALVKNGEAAVLFGHSGAGKSTTSAIALEHGYSVISDDINIIQPAGTGWQVMPVPFSGSLNAISDIRKPVPLKRIFRLHQSASDHVTPCSMARAVSLLAGSSPFVNQDNYRADQLVDILAHLAQSIPVQDLFFSRSADFLQYLDLGNDRKGLS